MTYDLTTWTPEEIARWLYAIGERSDRVISQAMYDDDWLDYEDDEAMYAELTAELARRGLRYTGKAIEQVGEAEPDETQ